jgi:hypothetical protein
MYLFFILLANGDEEVTLMLSATMSGFEELGSARKLIASTSL